MKKPKPLKQKLTKTLSGTVIIRRGHIGIFNSAIRHFSTAWMADRGVI